MFAIVLAVPLFYLYLWQRRKTSQVRQSQVASPAKLYSDSPDKVYTPYAPDTIGLFDQSCTSGSGSGNPILTKRTIARNIKIGDLIGSGRFGKVFIGEYEGDEMAVKQFASRDEHSWFREKEIYNTVLLRHDNILGFFASDIFSNDGATELWLITQYHPHGSLYDYLNRHTINPTIMMRMAISMCRGLTHLHTEFFGSEAKPAIAHRDIKSRNILVKRNRECCIADFGLAVIKNTSDKINFPMNPKQGTKRYMAPEILSESIDMENFESFLSVDIYDFGLVLWEMCKRCGDKNGKFNSLCYINLLLKKYEIQQIYTLCECTLPILAWHSNYTDGINIIVHTETEFMIVILRVYINLVVALHIIFNHF